MGLKRSDLISEEYELQLRALHRKGSFVGGGIKHAVQIRYLMQTVDARSALDYGCGSVDLSKALPGFDVRGYDPAIDGKDMLPGPADMVVCTDVLEHIEPDRLTAVLRHIFGLTIKGCFAVIALRPADKRLPDGRNAHLIIDNAAWWVERMREFHWKVGIKGVSSDELALWMRK